MRSLEIITDTREQRPYTFAGFDAEVTRGTLATGDYSLAGHERQVAVERKSLDDLVNCITRERERFERELQRSTELNHFCVVIESDIEAVTKRLYRSKAQPQAVLQSVIAFQVRYGVPFVWAGSRAGGEYMAFWTLARWLKEREARNLRLASLSRQLEAERMGRIVDAATDHVPLVEAF